MSDDAASRKDCVDPGVGTHWVLPRERLKELFAVLKRRSYRIIGPRVRDRAIAYDEIESDADLPNGWTDEQGPGHYRLVRRSDQAAFGYVVGPESFKKHFFVPSERLFSVRRSETGHTLFPEPPKSEKLALIGARSCDLHALSRQDRIFLSGPHQDSHYAARRQDVFVVAVQCQKAADTCFCASMGTGPRANAGFDLALTELVSAPHRFVVEVGSGGGADVLSELGLSFAPDSDVELSIQIVERTRANMGRQLETENIRELLYENREHAHWDRVAERCLSCTNCTMVCPTCFCSTTEDTLSVSGDQAERHRLWDSCFTPDFSYLHGGAVRASTKSRYRHWLTHKLASWIDQFGSSGCVGCGRCISWCPVGIDLTEEVAALRQKVVGRQQTDKKES